MDGGSVLPRTTRQAPAPAPQSLYASRVKVHPKAVHGRFRRLKWMVLSVCLLVYYALPWLRWDRGPGAPDQALLIDVNGPRAYIFGLEIWPQEIYLLTGLLILAALGIFLASTLLGRLWCGFACPQTVWTDLFMAVERLIEGDRAARIRLDKQPMNASKAAKRAAKHAAWLVISFATGGAWILYFADAPTIAGQFFHGEAAIEAYAFTALFTATTYTLAGWAREQVCTYMCPWPRFQGSMLDEHSLVVTYRDCRGEPRVASKKAAQPGSGDCVDCAQCFTACPVGIDIRDGQQPECINCGLCIDSCNEVMIKVGREHGLIAFDTLARLSAIHKGETPRYKLVRPRTVIYSVLILLVSALLAVSVLGRSTAELHVMRDRAPLFVMLSDGGVRNGYTLKVQNKRRDVQEYALTMEGLPGAFLEVQDIGQGGDGEPVRFHAEPEAVTTLRVFVAAPRAVLKGDSTPITFRLLEAGPGVATATTAAATTENVFLAPRR
ncbi:cytochrome c oxidase accessory protein CcoG [Azospirillum sp. SYSU D00513]|uniref:cytochrome c oxidase accessory protein CcoG n=1 Tax=Azospirillum sp. SYSU D00513 TaxID=2812561 RepID=UPI001A96AB96|nr:cytochrome c oxidase accessory protein CcoG [Azospirillum sp. SYSU D00513]